MEERLTTVAAVVASTRGKIAKNPSFHQQAQRHNTFLHGGYGIQQTLDNSHSSPLET